MKSRRDEPDPTEREKIVQVGKGLCHAEKAFFYLEETTNYASRGGGRRRECGRVGRRFDLSQLAWGWFADANVGRPRLGCGGQCHLP